jgi:hypothetical protein
MMYHLENSLVIAQTQPAQPADSSIDRSGEHLIYIGVGGIAVVLAIIVGLFSRRMIEAIIFSLVLSAIVIVLIFVA